MSADAINTAEKKQIGRPFVKGVVPNPNGRPKGSRNKLGEAFIAALHDDFQEHGVAAIQVVRAEKPDQYLKVIASLLPKDVNLNISDRNEMTDDELIASIRSLTASVAPFLISGTRDAAEGTGGTTSEAEPSIVH